MSILKTRLGYGKEAMVEMDTFTRIMKGEFWDFEEVRYDRPMDYKDAYAYIGVAPAGSPTTDFVWFCIRRTYNAFGKVARDQFRSNMAWDDRASNWY